VPWSPRVRTVVSVAGLAGLALVLGGCSALYPPDAATTQGGDIRSLYSVFMVPIVAIFILVEGLIVWSVVRYRRRKGDDELPVQTHGNNVLEITWTVLPTILVLVLFVLSWQTLNKVDAKSANPDLTVDVTGFQWQWTFAYPQYGLSYTGIGDQGPVLVLPADEVVHFRLHSSDVIHSFYVPDFLFKRDVIPGQVNNFDLTVKDAGVTYSGQCAQLCGMNHYQMRFTVQTMTPAGFQAWVQAEQAKAKATPAPAASGQAAGPVVKLSASNTTSFDESALSAPAGQPFSVELTNKTSGAPHNFSIKDASGTVIFTGLPLAQPGQTVSYSVPALTAGTYTFFCSVHPNMTGTLTVK
jgi:cytochrome c oxidase subunit II